MSIVARPGRLTFPPVDYANLPPECQTQEFQTPEGRMNLAREYVIARTNLFEGIENNTPAGDRINRIWKYCQKEIQTAFDDRDEAMAKQRMVDFVNSLNPVFRAIWRFFRKIEEITKNPVYEALYYGGSILFISGCFFIVEKNPSTAFLIATGLGFAIGTAFICYAIFLTIKQKYFQ